MYYKPVDNRNVNFPRSCREPRLKEDWINLISKFPSFNVEKFLKGRRVTRWAQKKNLKRKYRIKIGDVLSTPLMSALGKGSSVRGHLEIGNLSNRDFASIAYERLMWKKEKARQISMQKDSNILCRFLAHFRLIRLISTKFESIIFSLIRLHE